MADETDYQELMKKQSEDAGYLDMDVWFREQIYEQLRPYTMTSIERMYDMYESVKYISKANVFGDIVECGVWKGGSIMIAAKTLLHLDDTNRHLWLYDTFTGLPKPDNDELDIKGNKGSEYWARHVREDGTSNACRAELEEVRCNISMMGYPVYRIFYIKGMVEETTKNLANIPINIALLRLDTDWYSGAKASLEVFWPRLSLGGVLIIDDYGSFLGQKKAVTEYFEENNITDKMARIDYSGRTVIKTAHHNKFHV